MASHIGGLTHRIILLLTGSLPIPTYSVLKLTELGPGGENKPLLGGQNPGPPITGINSGSPFMQLRGPLG